MTPHPIRKLDNALIRRIAAGEVVDRPASVVKELVENSLDASTTHIKITLIEGGTQRIEIEDDGWGLSPEDLELCLERHATSKVHSIEQLDCIETLGFRGEALAAISSVSKLRIDTFREGRGTWVLRVVGGGPKHIEPSTRRQGTCVVVEDLFFNVPARFKFLKKTRTEGEECLEVLRQLALANPHVHFEWYLLNSKGELLVQQNLPKQSREQRFFNICRERLELPDFVLSKILHIQGVSESEQEKGLFELEIFCLPPPYASHTQKSVMLTVNGRNVLDKRLPYSLREAYMGLIESAQFPFAWVRVQIDAHQIDVNIHPQKKELRWPRDFNLAGLVYNRVRPLFSIQPPSPELSAPQMNLADVSLNAKESHNFESFSSLNLFETIERHKKTDDSTTSASTSWKQYSPLNWQPPIASPSSTSNLAQPPFRFSSLKIIGECGAAWLLCESPSGLVIIDQHAAHERVNYENVLTGRADICVKPLLLPIKWLLPKGLEVSQRLQLLSAIENLGFEAELVDDSNTLQIIAVPITERQIDWADEFRRLSDTILCEEYVGDRLAVIRNKIAASVACHGSIRRGNRLKNEEIQQLLKQLDEVQWGAYCPHGRPVWFELSHNWIEKEFHR